MEGVERLRVVEPYVEHLKTFVKRRWTDRQLLDVLSSEFRTANVDEWRSQIEAGLLQVNGVQTTPHRVLKDGDYIEYERRVSEPPILQCDLIVQHETRHELLIVNKPPSWPVHKCGAYNRNSLLYILTSEHGYRGPLHPINRLDRLTSGLVLIALTPAAARKHKLAMERLEVAKRYYARVKGQFPEHAFPSTAATARTPESARCSTAPSDHPRQYCHSTGPCKLRLWASCAPPTNTPVNTRPTVAEATETGDCSGMGSEHAASASTETGDCSGMGSEHAASASTETSYCSGMGSEHAASASPAVVVRAPLRCVDKRRGVHECHPDGVPAETVITLVSYDPQSETSVVRCEPRTGRTHQIRVHLQWLGHPIANDPNYGTLDGTRIAPPYPTKRKRGSPDAVQTPTSSLADACDSAKQEPGEGEKARGTVTDVAATADRATESPTESQSKRADAGGADVCSASVGSTAPDPVGGHAVLACRGIWLHAYVYEAAGQVYRVGLPDWVGGIPQTPDGMG